MKPGFDYKTLTVAAGILVALLILAIVFFPDSSTLSETILGSNRQIGDNSAFR